MNSNEFLTKAKASFKERLNNEELQEFHVESLGLTVYYPLTVSLSRKDIIAKSMQKGGLEHMVDIVLEIARDDSGNPLFKKSNRRLDRKALLEQVDPAIIMDMAAVMSATLNADIEEEGVQEEAEKNSE